MNTNSPPTSTPPAEKSHMGDNSPNDQMALGESEAMRRMQDLLATGKLCVSDTVVFEYDRFSFTARLMADGSLRSNTGPKDPGIHMEETASKLYSSPSEFASAMAACVALLDEKITKTKGKVSINGWNSCTANGRSLATIRNEMLHERKKGKLANLSTERVRESNPAVATRKHPERRPADSSAFSEGSVADKTAGLICSSQGFEKSSRNRQDNLPGAHQSPVEMKEPNLLTYRDDNTSRERKECTTKEEQHVPPSFEGALDANAPPRTPPLHKPVVHRTSSSPKTAINDISERACSSLRDSLEASAENSCLHDKMREDESIFKVCDEQRTERTTKIIAKPGKQKSTREKIADYRESQDLHDGFPEDGSVAKKRANAIGDEEKTVNVEETSTFAAEALRQAKTKDQQQKTHEHSASEGIKSQALGTHLKTISSSKAAINLASESKGSSCRSKESKGTKDRQSVSVELCDDICTAQQENVTLQARSSKEVSDLQQEILGDSDSDEEGFLEQEKRNMRFLKKRSRSPSSEENRKKTRTGDYPHPDMGSAGTRPGIVQGLIFDDRTLPSDNKDAEIEDVHLDPDTMEAAAIAAQIEKEEANNRARRTTRLAAGKIKQVDYKASAGVQAPRSGSPELGWEENNKRSIEIEPSVEVARATRRRSATNQLQPPQRTSRRVAKLRNNHEREISSNEETGHVGARSLGGGNGSDKRSERESIHNEDMERVGSQGFRLNGLRSDANDRRRGRTEPSSKRTRHYFHEEGDPDSHGRAYSTRASTRENSIVDAADIEDLCDQDDFLSDPEDLQDLCDAVNGSDLFSLKIGDIKGISDAVRSCRSVDPKVIFKFLEEQDEWKSDDLKKHRIREFLQEIIECIQNLPKPFASQVDATGSEQILSFLSAEVWRLSTGGDNDGSTRNPTTLLRRVGKEDQMRASSERSRKKEHRDVEELRMSLEKEMESRRRAELDALLTEIQLCEASRSVGREKTKCCRLSQETDKYRDMQRIIRRRLEGAKVLVGQLRGETDESDAIAAGASRTSIRNGTQRAESPTNGSFALPSLLSGRKGRIAEDDTAMTNKNVTTTSRRLMEMDRLRVLIAAREAEAEEFQRICEKERTRFLSAVELKTRIEAEIYLNKSQGSVAYGFGNSSPLPVVNNTAKDSLKKVDTRAVSSHISRGSGYTKQKSGSFGKNTAAMQFTSNQKLYFPGSRQKPGRALEVPKQAKRKPFGRNGGNGNDKL